MCMYETRTVSQESGPGVGGEAGTAIPSQYLGTISQLRIPKETLDVHTPFPTH